MILLICYRVDFKKDLFEILDYMIESRRETINKIQANCFNVTMKEITF